MSCGCGCGGAAGGSSGSPPSWRTTQIEPGGGGCNGKGGGGGQLGQPGRAPGRASSGHGFPWWVWIIVALVGYRLLKGST